MPIRTMKRKGMLDAYRITFPQPEEVTKTLRNSEAEVKVVDGYSNLTVDVFVVRGQGVLEEAARRGFRNVQVAMVYPGSRGKRDQVELTQMGAQAQFALRAQAARQRHRGF